MVSEVESGNCLGWAARDASGVLSPYKFNRREIRTDDLSVKIMHCGVCYADFLLTRNKFGHKYVSLGTRDENAALKYLIKSLRLLIAHSGDLYKTGALPIYIMHCQDNLRLNAGKYHSKRHEIVGVVKETGTNVKHFKVGDYVGVGTYVDSCRDCEYCNESREIYCDKTVFTFDRVDKDGTITKGGFSSHIVVHERYCYKIPDGYPLEKAAPLLCAGITVYMPMIKYHMNQPDKSLGIIGLGGLGHMAVKFGKAFGLEVTVISTSKSKKEEAIDLLLADRFLLFTDEKQMESAAKSLDFIIDTASGDHPFDPYLSLLKVDGVMVLVGFPSEIKIQPINLNFGSRCIAGSLGDSTKDTEEMLEFCAKNRVYPEVEMISIEYVNKALDRLEKRDVKYRFVIDISNSLNEDY